MNDLDGSTDRERFSNWGLALLAGLVALFLASRLVALLKMPVFIDEAIHIWWAREIQEGMVAAGFIEGRWLSMALMSLFLNLPGDDLWLVRFSAVLAGVATLGALFLIGRELFSNRAGILAILFYLVIPYALFYDRVALADSIATPFGAWILYLSIKSVRSQWGGNSVILALLLIFSMLVKISGIAYLIIPPITVLVLLPSSRWKKGIQRIMPAMLAGLLMLAAIYIVGIPTHQVTPKAQAFSIAGVLQATIRNSGTLANWSWYLLGPPVAILSGLMLLWSILTRPGRPAWFLLAILITSLAPYLVFAQDWYPRYLTFALVPLVLLLAQSFCWVMDQIASRTATTKQAQTISAVLLGLLLIWPVVIDLSLLSNPESAPLPEILEWEFKSGWPAGFGAEEMANFLEEEAAQTTRTLYIIQPIFWAHTNKGGLQVHLTEENKLEFVELGWDLESELAELAGQLETGRRVLIVVDSTHPQSADLFDTVEPQLEATLIWHYPKPGSAAGLEVWEVAQIDLTNIPAEG